MNAWGDEDPPSVEAEPRSRRRMHGRHYVLLGIVVAAVGPLVSLAGGRGLGGLLVALGVTLATIGAFGWVFERMGAWDDDPGSDPNAIKLLDVAHLATRNRRH
jgi:hypothetical protein